MKPKILVLGGAGYIGSHMVRMLLSEGYSPVVIDDLSGGFASAVADAEFIVGSISDKNFLRTIFHLTRSLP